MNPVIHGAEIQHAAGVLVTLSAGEVELPEGFDLDEFTVTVVPVEGDESTLPFLEGDEDFRAHFRYLIAANGPFEVRLNAPEGLLVEVDPASPQSVHPATGETVHVDWVLTSAVEDTEDTED